MGFKKKYPTHNTTPYYTLNCLLNLIIVYTYSRSILSRYNSFPGRRGPLSRHCPPTKSKSKSKLSYAPTLAVLE